LTKKFHIIGTTISTKILQNNTDKSAVADATKSFHKKKKKKEKKKKKYFKKKKKKKDTTKSVMPFWFENRERICRIKEKKRLQLPCI